MTPEQALALAPDPASAKAGRELAVLRKWQAPGRMGDTVIWGEMQGSGKLPYRTVVDLGAPAFNCSCPSRKFPCKHGLALLLLHVENGAGFGVADAPPEWAAKWLEGRNQRAEKKAVQAEARKNEEADPAAAEKRAAQRSRRVADGLASLELWLLDLARNGIGHAQAQPAEFWLQQSRRLIDAQAPGVATMVASLGEAAASGNGWQSRLLGGIGRLQLLIDGHRRLANGLAEGRVRVDGCQDFLVGGFHLDGEAHLGDHFSGVRPDDVRAEDFAVLGADDEFHEPVALAYREGFAARHKR